MLSCYPMTSVDTSTYEEITTLQDSSFPATTINIKQSQDFLPELHKKLNTSKMYSTIQREGINIICRNGKINLGPALFAEILAWYHVNLNHPGQDRTYRNINAVFFMPNMEAKVRQYVDQCHICKKSKISTKK